MRRTAVALIALGCAACSAPADPVNSPGSLSSSAVSRAAVSSSSLASSMTGTAAASTSAQPAPPYIAAVRWVSGRRGNDLVVTPTDSARAVLGSSAQGAAWREVVRLAPPAATVSMHRQFDCHWRYARSKAQWNLEPWRPVVPMDEVVAAYCNPGGPE